MGLMDRFAEWVWRRFPALAVLAVLVAAFGLFAIGLELVFFSAELGESAMTFAGVGIVCVFAPAVVVGVAFGVAVAWRRWRKL